MLKAERMEKVKTDFRGALYMEALAMQNRGEKIMMLNTGNPATFGFHMPESVRGIITERMDEAVGYCDLRGMIDAREAILEYHIEKGVKGISADDVFIGNGVSELVTMAMTATLNKGDEFLLPMPCYSMWSNSTILVDAKPVYYLCDESNDWQPDIEDIRSKVTPRTKAILLINPNNPTGVVYSKEVLQSVIEIAREHDLLILSDEIYDRLVLDGEPHIATAALAPDLAVITMNGLSKSHNICGFRCGWMLLSGPRSKTRELTEAFMTLAALRLCGNALTQLIIPAMLKDTESTQAMLRPGGRLYEQRKVTFEELDKIDGLSYVKNRAAFYLFPRLDIERFGITDDKKFARDLLIATKILIVPGTGFDWHSPDHFRIVMLPEPEQLRAGMQKLGDFLDELARKNRRLRYSIA